MRLERLFAEVPPGRLSAASVIAEAGGGAEEISTFTRLFGMESVARADPERSLGEYLLRVVDGLGALDPDERPDALFHVHAQPNVARDRLPPLAALRAEHPSLSALRFVFDVDQYNCAGVFWALAAARRMLSQGLIERALVFAGDNLAQWPARLRYVPGSTLLGDAFAAMLVTDAPGGMRIGPIATRQDACFVSGVDAGAEESRAFNAAHLGLVDAALAEVGHVCGRRLLPHQINGLCWRLFCRRNGLPESAVATALVREIGHCCTADALVLLAAELGDAAVPRDRTLLSVGMGGFVGACGIHQSDDSGRLPC